MSHEIPFLNRYEKEATAKLEAIARRPLTDGEAETLRALIAARVRDRRAVIYNPHTERSAETTMTRVAGWLTDRKPHPPIVTGHGTIFRNHDEFHSIVGDLVDFLMKTRKVAKNQMFDLMRAGARPDEPEVKALDQRQKIFKLLSNSWYGAYGEKGFHFYNEALGPAVTYQGQIIISSTLFGFESFLSGNLWLRNRDEMARHVADCLARAGGRDPQEAWGEHPGLVASIEDGDVAEVLALGSAPGWDARAYAAELEARMTPAEKLAIVMRGNPYLFLTFPRAFELLQVALGGEIREADPEKMEKHHPEGKAALEELWEGLKDWVAIHWMPADMPRMAASMTRRVVILTDTDSTFLNLHPWMQWLDENAGLAGATEEQRLTGLNAMVYLLRLLSDYQMSCLTRNLGVPERKRRLINFKSEFVIARMVLTDGKKNYAALNRFQEGARIVGDKVELKGLAMKKTTVARSTGTFFERSIETKILRSPTIDRVGLVRDIVTLEDRIRRSIAGGETEYSAPAVLGRMSEYADMYAMPVVRGTIAWNTVEVNRPIREGDRVNTFRLRIGTDAAALAALGQSRPEGSPERAAVDALLASFFGAEAEPGLSSNGLNWVCVPKDVTVLPAWVLDMIDGESVILANTSVVHPLLESVGIRVLSRPAPESYSTIIRF